MGGGQHMCIEATMLYHGEDERSDHIMLMNLENNCFECCHLHDDMETCDAYPDGVPTELLYLDRSHDRPHAGDHGIQFERKHELDEVRQKKSEDLRTEKAKKAKE